MVCDIFIIVVLVGRVVGIPQQPFGGGYPQSSQNPQSSQRLSPFGKGNNLGSLASAAGAPQDMEAYNCAGLAFKTYKFHSQKETERILSNMSKVDCKAPCNVNQWRYHYWPYDSSQTNTRTGQTDDSHKDFHIVGGQTDENGLGPHSIYSKNGHRPIEGPATLKSWFPVTGIQKENDNSNRPVPNMISNRYNVVESCWCTNRPPGAR
jgi:hypothetical protein